MSSFYTGCRRFSPLFIVFGFEIFFAEVRETEIRLRILEATRKILPRDMANGERGWEG